MLIIVGFSGFGKEVYWLAKRLGIEVKGFLDDNSAVLGATFSGSQVLGTVDTWSQHQDCEFVVAIGNPRVRKIVVNKMREHGTPNFATLVDPAAIVDMAHVGVGAGSIICAGTVSTVDISIGEHSIINLNCTIGHDTVIENYVTVAPLVAISGNVRLEDEVEIGTGASIRQGLTVGKQAMLGMGSVLTKHMPERSVYFGSPAKLMRLLAQPQD